jgi:hypothetical protein
MQFFILNLKFEIHAFRPRRDHRPLHHLSLPDDKARAIKTFGDTVTVVQELVP